MLPQRTQPTVLEQLVQLVRLLLALGRLARVMRVRLTVPVRLAQLA